MMISVASRKGINGKTLIEYYPKEAARHIEKLWDRIVIHLAG